MITTIEWLLEQKEIPGFHFVAGKNGKTNKITGVNIIDNPDTIRFLVGGELILSTGYFLKEDEDLKNSFIKDLHSKNCAGLVIALKRYLNEIPQNMIDDANSIGFPIISVSFETNFSEISRMIYTNILHNEISDADQLYKMYHHLNKSLANEHTLKDTLNCIEQITGFPLLITNHQFELIEFSDKAVQYDIDTSQVTPFDSSACQNYLDTYQKCHFDVITRQNRVIFSIRDEVTLYGFMCFLNVDTNFNSIHYNFAYSILPLLSMELSNEMIRQKLSRQGKNNFLKNMLSGEMSESDIKDQCEIYGFSIDASRTCLVLQPDFSIDMTQNEKDCIFDNYGHFMKHITLSYPCATYSYHDDNNLVILLLSSINNQNRISDTTIQLAQALLDSFNNIDINCHIGISEILTGISTLHSGYMEALQALRLGRKLNSEQRIFRYSVNMLSHLVSNLQPDSYIYDSYLKQLKPLFDFDNEHGTNLAVTLYEYLKNDCSIKDTANALFIHRNTLAIRLEKIKELLSTFDLNHFDDKVVLYIAFHIFKIKDM